MSKCYILWMYLKNNWVNVCKIKIGNEQSIGFFCKIPFPDENNLLPVFITNNHVINKKLLYSNNEKISFRIKEENKIK